MTHILHADFKLVDEEVNNSIVIISQFYLNKVVVGNISDSSDSNSENNPCLFTLCLVDPSGNDKCKYLYKCGFDCETVNVDSITKLPKFLKMMDQGTVLTAKFIMESFYLQSIQSN